MKMKTKLLFVGVTAIASMLGVAQIEGFPEMRLTVHVIGEDGKPVADAKATFLFVEDMATWDEPAKVDVTTDSNGDFTLDEPSHSGVLESTFPPIHKEGYYYSGVPGAHFYNLKDNKWQPWDQTFTTTLRKIGNPVPMYVRNMSSDIPAVGVSCGYDLEEADWVAPYGKGKVTDFIVTVTHLEYTDYNNNEMTAIITFPNDGDGIQKVTLPQEFAGSMFRWPREAFENGYQSKLDVRHMWSMSSQGTNIIETSKGVEGYFFRVRTVKQGDKFISALYGKIKGGVSIGPNNAKPSIGFTYYLNPTPNDRNMEWDPTKNLAPTPKDN
jgi:hypothetical protein